MNQNVIGFNGERPDRVSNILHLGNGYRTYCPSLMRFHRPDGWSPFGTGGVNPYVYCVGDPINQSDPSGHFSLGQGIGIALGFVAGIALSIMTEGLAMPVVLTLMATVVGDAAIGAGTELVTEAADRKQISWESVGISAGLSAAASLAGFGLGIASNLKGTSKRPFGGLMMAEASDALNQGGRIQRTAGEIDPLAFIRNPENFIHHIDMGTGAITSERIGSSTDTFFLNKYKPHKWTFVENRRAAEEPFYMTDVVKYQYDAVSQINNFKGRLPVLLKRKNVTNLITLQETMGKTGQELFDIFFRDTPNGRSTLRILNDFGLKPTSVERQSINQIDEEDGMEYQQISFLIQCAAR